MSAEQFEIFVPRFFQNDISYDSKTGERTIKKLDEPREVDVNEAFASVVQEAAYDFGHSGFTGSIAEKDDFLMMRDEPVNGDTAIALIEEYLQDERASKWAPAQCLEVKAEAPDESEGWWFFGLASS